ncbi:DUF4229 domain-containing protein [Thermomonospora umbrina]|uniref:Uncharacterized protein DUF4229 n=1 Tax=Thermomonospora umbrina TaxID=111806 RepID=A0A3D9SQW7_9ACTN|nr:DUF4229 domain-containing protein [Thermomonospora umbrina]REE98027.1 uncharacterized protein DUF4229 [Thermomonospora umbrina]
MRAFLAYTAARLAIFAVTIGVLILVVDLDYDKPGAMLLLLALSVGISGVVSYVLLAGLRDKVSESLTGGIGNQRQRFERDRAKEDSSDSQP